jgi:hypothetical protein
MEIMLLTSLVSKSKSIDERHKNQEERMRYLMVDATTYFKTYIDQLEESQKTHIETV